MVSYCDGDVDDENGDDVEMIERHAAKQSGTPSP